VPEVSRQEFGWADGTKAFGAVRAKIASWRQLNDEQTKVVVSAPAHVAVPLECYKVMS
jgi:hypothetical protein